MEHSRENGKETRLTGDQRKDRNHPNRSLSKIG